MSTITRIMAATALAACGGGADGTWSGSCDLDGVGGPAQYDIQSFQVTDRGGALSGEAQVWPDWLDAPIIGFLSGERAGTDVVLEAAMGDAVMNFVLTLEGTLQGDVIEGACSSGVDEGIEAGTGRIVRVDSGVAGG